MERHRTPQTQRAIPLLLADLALTAAKLLLGICKKAWHTHVPQHCALANRILVDGHNALLQTKKATKLTIKQKGQVRKWLSG